MKKQLLVTGLLVVVVSILRPAASHAGSIDYLTNQSADYIRMLSRNAATDAADIVVYNPAGTAMLGSGLYLNLNTQTIFKDYEITYDGTTYAATNPTPILPTFYAVYKWRSLATFAAFTVPAGGGSLSYDEGLPYLQPLALAVPEKTGYGATDQPTNGWFKGSSMYLAGTFGAAYELLDKVAVSAAGRVITANKSYEGSATYGASVASLKADKKAAGFGGIFGLHLRPIKQLDIGVRYETETPLEFETSSTTVNVATDKGKALESFADGAKEKRNLPATLAFGVDVHILPELTFSASLNYYFIKAADSADDVPGPTGYVISYDDDYDNGLELGVGLQYQLTEMVAASFGYNRTFPGGNAKTYSDFEYVLPANSFGGGARISLTQRLDLTAGLCAVFYEEAQNEMLHPMGVALPQFANPETFDKFAFVVALGAQYRLF